MLMEYLCRLHFGIFWNFHIDRSLELDGKIVQYFKIAGPWEMRLPQHELLKLRDCSEKST